MKSLKSQFLSHVRNTDLSFSMIRIFFREVGISYLSLIQMNKVSRRDRTSKARVRSRIMWVLWQRSTGRGWRHLDCNTCSLRTWLRAADLHAGHAYSIMGRMSCLNSRTPFLTARSLFLFRRGPSVPNPRVALFLTWSMWGDQVSRLSWVTPR